MANTDKSVFQQPTAAALAHDEPSAEVHAITSSTRFFGHPAGLSTLFFTTPGDFEIGVFRQTSRGTAVVLTTGICDRATATLSLDDLAKIRAMIQEAKTRLDEIR